ncbi:hypothetical protein LEMA_P090780.1 [Plenodomus lingam JN3]|uniref:MARVEL domain-containing protein n=1 Tax=Leptosphaeria maculans (strain JN3 / isolate v23.1.3 / race Av1-4-5-6-7-8) TaxID=985895 RepID=E5A1V2_LEPMJ|nr:hypothetical protein LEMA_P090780.1 [Plenodomus lingam JN3]CBX97669.1 hypothetical protein LEMA_P090780.1 [Plenodomus lingam JN3]
MARTHTAANDYGAPVTNNRSNKLYRPLIMANHVLHWISSIIVLGISAYFIHRYRHNTHLVYWLSIAAVDALLYIPAIALPAMKRYKGHGAPLAWIFSYLWLTAFIFAAQDYNYGSCALRSPAFVNKCALKKTIEAFAFLAFFTNVVGTALEARLYDVNRVRGTNATLVEDKHAAGAVPVTSTAPHGTTTTAPVHTTV